MEAFAKSERGEQIWKLHQHLGVSLVDSQSDMYPMQRRFLMLAADAHEEETPSQNNMPNEARKYM